MRIISPRLALLSTFFAAGCAVPGGPHEANALALFPIDSEASFEAPPLEARLVAAPRDTTPFTSVERTTIGNGVLLAPGVPGTGTDSNSEWLPPQNGNVADPWEVTVNGAGSNDRKFDAGGGSLAASLGYYFSEVFEGSVRQLITFSDAGKNSSSVINGATRVALDAHLAPRDSKVVPYVGANFGMVYGDSVNETFVAGPEGGLKVYVKNDVFFLVGVEYLFFFEDSDDASDAFDDGQFIYNLGFGVRF